MRKLCIYHGNCADGFTAAWAARRAIGEDAHFLPATYGDLPPDVAGKDVFIVDFSYKRPVLEAMAYTARSITVLDHHKTAAEDLIGLPQPVDWYTAGGAPMPGLYALFDMNRSGAGVTWDYFFPGAPRPQLLNHIEDRDLWRFALPGTREIQSEVFSHEYTFATWDKLMQEPLDELARAGEAIDRKHLKDVRELIKVTTRRMVLGGHNVPIANLPYTYVSDAANILAEGEPFAGCYWDVPGFRTFGLRSKPGGADVGEIAKLYGGGGHKHAAGFRLDYAAAAALEV